MLTILRVKCKITYLDITIQFDFVPYILELVGTYALSTGGNLGSVGPWCPFVL